MMILPIAKAAAGAVTATLALSSGRNMLQTFQISRAHQETTDTKAPWVPPSLHRQSDPDPVTDPTSTTVTAKSVVSDLEELSRKELVELFLSCQPPANAAEIEGEWNGVLLENNGFVLVGSNYTFVGACLLSIVLICRHTHAHSTTFYLIYLDIGIKYFDQ
jgi:hypothetical protein